MKLDVKKSYRPAKKLANHVRSNWYNDPVGFGQKILRVKEFHEKPQLLGLREMASTNDVLMRTGHGVGKSFTLAAAILWFFWTRPFCRIPIIGPSWSQLKRFLWAEIDKMWLRLPKEFQAAAHKTKQQSFYMKGPGKSAHYEPWKNLWCSFTFSANTDPDLLEGLHAGRVFIVIDEAKAVKKEAFDAIEGQITEKGIYQKVMASTPGDPTGEFYDANTKHADRWNIIHATQYDSPMINPQTIEDKKKRWGESSPIFISKVLGNFAPGGIDRIFTLTALENAMGKMPAIEGDRWLGVDVARFGNDMTAFVIYQGGQVLHYEQYGGRDLMHTAGRITDFVRKGEIEGVCIDDRGLGGGVTDRLRETLPASVEMVPITGEERAQDEEHYANWQTELLFDIQDKMNTGELRLGNFEELRAQLSTIPYEFTSAGQFKMPSRPKFHLPDGGAALSYAHYGASVAHGSSLSAFDDLNRAAVIPSQW